MLLKWIKRHLPKKETIKEHRLLSWLGVRLHQPDLWHLNCHSVSRGVAIGLFIAVIPLPLQMLLAALAAILFRANLPIAVMMTWINNPFTFIAINYFIYFVGQWILGQPIEITEPKLDWQWGSIHGFWTSLMMMMAQFGKAFFIGLPIVAFATAILGYFIVLVVCQIMRVIKIIIAKNKVR